MTLTPEQYSFRIVSLQGTLTGNTAVIFPATAQEWLIENDTTGDAVSVQTSGQATPLVLVPGAQMIYTDGANVGNIINGTPVTSFNTRTGAVTLEAPDVAAALGYTPQSSALSVGSTTTAGALTLTAAQLTAGYFSDGATQTAAFTLTTDTAANLLAAMPNAQVGTAFRFRLFNNDQSTTGFAATLAAGAGVTLATTLPNPAVPQGGWADYLFSFTAVGAAPAVTVTPFNAMVAKAVTGALGYTPPNPANTGGYTWAGPQTFNGTFTFPGEFYPGGGTRAFSFITPNWGDFTGNSNDVYGDGQVCFVAVAPAAAAGYTFTGIDARLFEYSLTTSGTLLLRFPQGEVDINVTSANGGIAGKNFQASNSATLAGTTAGGITSTMPLQGVAKKFMAYANGYENDTATVQTITFPRAFSNPPVITTNTSGLSLSVSTTALTINAPNATTRFNGLIIVEGI